MGYTIKALMMFMSSLYSSLKAYGIKNIRPWYYASGLSSTLFTSLLKSNAYALSLLYYFHSWKNERFIIWNILSTLIHFIFFIPTSVFEQSNDWSSFKNKGFKNLVLQMDEWKCISSSSHQQDHKSWRFVATCVIEDLEAFSLFGRRWIIVRHP